MTTSPPNSQALERRGAGPLHESDTGLVVDRLTHSFRAQGSGRWSRSATRHTVLHDISFTVPRGTLTAIIGPSGCGKSTLLRVLAGLETADSGAARIGAQRITGRPGSVVYHPQQDALLPWLRVIDNATLGWVTSGGGPAEGEARAMELLDRFGLSRLQRAWPDELSGGMRQRVALMRTFLMPQGALLLDEPFGALDALTRHQLQLWLLGIIAQEDRPTLFVTHDVDEALLLADEIIVLGRAGEGIALRESRPDADARRAQHESGADREISRRIHAALAAPVPGRPGRLR